MRRDADLKDVGHRRRPGTGSELPAARPMYDVFNGPDHSEDPRPAGYVGSDGEHLLPAGREVMMAALHGAGYEPIGRSEG